MALLLAAILALSVPAGCGGDDEEPAADAPATVPELTVPQTDEVEPPPAPTQTETTPPEPTEAVPPPDDGGTPAPEPEPPPPDTPENDTPPPPDSPAERFEEFCNDNPGACG